MCGFYISYLEIPTTHGTRRLLKLHLGTQCPQSTVGRALVEHDFYTWGMSMCIFIFKVYLLFQFHYPSYFNYSSIIKITLAFRFPAASDVLKIMKH